MHSPPFACQQLRAPNDPSGLPRVLWLVYGQLGDIQRIIVDGKAFSLGTLPAGLESLVRLPTMIIALGVYSGWVQVGLNSGILEHL